MAQVAISTRQMSGSSQGALPDVNLRLAQPKKAVISAGEYGRALSEMSNRAYWMLRPQWAAALHSD